VKPLVGISFVLSVYCSAVFVIAWILVLLVIILAVLCQLNFGIGLHRYLDPNGTGNFRHNLGSNGDIENGTTPFVVTFPDEKSLQREASVSSNSSTLRSEQSYGYSKGILSRSALMAAQPGSIKILPPVPAALNDNDSPLSKGASMPPNPLRKYGKALWGRTTRHESAMSFGHMDASKLNRGASIVPAPSNAPLPLASGLEADKLSRDGAQTVTPPLTRPQPSQRVDSMGSIYSINSNIQRLVLVNAL
jgi:hypothetical protein